MFEMRYNNINRFIFGIRCYEITNIHPLLHLIDNIEPLWIEEI